MKEIILSIALVSGLMADTFVGADVLYGNVDTDVNVNNLVGVKQDTKTRGLRLKAGKNFKSIRATGFIQYEDYSDNIVLTTEKHNLSIGASIDYMFTNSFYTGVVVGIGKKDLGDNPYKNSVDFNDIGLRGGFLIDNVEIGIDYKRRSYSTVTRNAISVKEDDKLLSAYIGYNFNL